MIVFIVGMPGAGKSTVAKALASELEWQVCEADDLMTADAKATTKSGQLLSAAQLDEWISKTVIPHALSLEKNSPVVVSGWLPDKEKYLQLKNAANQLVCLNLQVSYDELVRRIESRSDHIAGREVLDLCWKYKEEAIPPGITIDANQSVDQILINCLKILQDIEYQR